MTVNFKKTAHILAVHGVQSGGDAEVNAKERIQKLVSKSLATSHLSRKFEVQEYLYEGINDNAQKLYERIGKALLKSVPYAGMVLPAGMDLVGDVVTASLQTSTAAKIRRGLRKQILSSYDSGHQVVLVAHSLGTVYALDVVSELMASKKYFLGDNRKTWPVKALITMGSPLGLDLIFPKRKIATLAGADYAVFPWHNYFNRRDPVVSGSLFGRPVSVSGSRGPIEKLYGKHTEAANWLLDGHGVTSGKSWAFSHLTYWKNPKIGGKIVDLLWG